MKGFLALTVAVLAAIGIGIGVEAAVGVGSTSYEANGTSFVARFPSPSTTAHLTFHNCGQITAFVSHYRGSTFGLVIEHKPSMPLSVQEKKEFNHRVCELGLYCGWVAYAPFTNSSVSFAGQEPSEVSTSVSGMERSTTF